VAVLVVAGAIALAACGTPADSGNAIEVLEENRATDLEHAFSGTEAPVPQGSRGLLSQILGTDTVDLEMAFSGVAAPAAGIGAIGLPQAADPEAAFSGIEAPVAQGKGWSQAHADPASGPR
jgi:hypothetical protein